MPSSFTLLFWDRNSFTSSRLTHRMTLGFMLAASVFCASASDAKTIASEWICAVVPNP